MAQRTLKFDALSFAVFASIASLLTSNSALMLTTLIVMGSATSLSASASKVPPVMDGPDSTITS
ncbi:uncharacterized protein BT62DRAFT_937461 [Guyanagaster necrorhizus]|uniref:Uncharacterized protein n=1 Tax=Guyanagaster necrorhizus TaxID=856835 RepID=A0A9P7VI93_9AGAR|nr:uncharacterized protein BT62DRAFT_937461 [Guyanagaster necrorhizus MCA 3950]KAG7441027.1 hypothetical protein BT62DRAFT_937461 [Guyanagaster necrorhizus MCA 3950]